MTISSSLNAGVTGLFANASRLATISDNIANSATYGYKRAGTDFSSLVLTESAGSYTAGGVRAQSYREVSGKSTLVGTTNSTDIAVSGVGMLPVSTISAIGAGVLNPPLLLTTTGSFRADEQGYLTTASGLVLMGWAASTDGSIPSNSRDSASGLEPIRIASGYSARETSEIELGVNLPATAAQDAVTAGTAGDTLELPIEYYDTLGASQTLTTTFTPTGAADNEWTVEFSDTGGVLDTITVTFDDTAGMGGALLSVTPLTNYDITTGKLSLTLSSGNALTVDIGAPGDTDNLTQLAAEFAPVGIFKDGAPAGTLTDVEIDQNGFLNAIYDTGFTRTIYQVPLVSVPNTNGLKAESNQTFSVTKESGQFYLWDAGAGPTGEVNGYALEESATDIAAELTQMIQTQRAYSSNAKVIQTVDEMLQETTNLKR
ncbi:flagellar hook-basal body complex protein (plasmid) [Paroceanicella profunda]|uniref:Flagellar hook protein FlgE n=1 Tax=Paroceanicella profunda TaxID=2579971 RepID=A0A5B8FJC8_9RHOB|nr:flagellar hook-basal body complex protein [Paroceanicella profunda]QDL94741.1 flagellar hook-basal body complex protein [Paroceanicella profunda]